MTPKKYPKFNLKNKIVASLVGLILVIFSLLYFIVIPTIRDIKTMSNEIEGQRIDLEKKYIKGQSLRQLTENLKKIESKLDMLDQIFINKNRELEFITTLENQANKNWVSQKINLSAPQEAENQNFQKTDLQLFTKGSFLGQLQYLLDLEYLSYYINVKLLELSAAGAGEQTKTDSQEISPSPGETNNINMYINADTYWN
jgi:Tfp pilus assembly protein PilO